MTVEERLQMAEGLLCKILDTEAGMGGYVDLVVGTVDTRPDFTDEEIAYLEALLGPEISRGDQ